MDFSSFAFLCYLLVAVFFIAFPFSLAKRSWGAMLISCVSSLPVVYYFLGYPVEWVKFLLIIPFLLLILAITFFGAKEKELLHIVNRG